MSDSSENLLSSIPQLSWPEVQEKLKQPGVALIDVRTEEKHQHFNIGGKNIPIDQLESHSPELESYNELIFYCTSGNKSTRAAGLAESLLPGVKVYSLLNGVSSLKPE
ncbi:rhodanese-like domain-containing protein [Leadbetterella sp. DM7]|uniref:rhodanese-like domain-containing protein n=1 Tax=Leadbetterella sp. DM7 TaxID=3235085 RepID=UPI00349ED22C